MNTLFTYNSPTGYKMGFWHILDHVVGFIPVVRTVKDAIEAGVEEAKGNHGAARDRIIDAATSLAWDIVTVATLGTDAELATAGKMAAEEVFKQAAKGEVISTAETMALRVGGKGATVVAAATAGRHAKKALRKNWHKPDISPLLKPPTNPPKEPKRGHHVINNGVIRIFRDIIDNFFEEHRLKIFLDKSYEDLVDEGIINQTDTPSLMSSHDQPLPSNICLEIEEMSAFTPPGETHSDTNDVIFGVSKVGLLIVVTRLVLYVFASLNETGTMPELKAGFLKEMESMVYVTAFITQAHRNQNGVYVDNQALRWWLNREGQMEQFIRCGDNVRNMFDSLADVRRLPDERVACTWGREIFHIYRRLVDRHNLPQKQLLTILNPVSYVKSSDRPPDHAIKLGFQNNRADTLWSAVAKSEWGLIPGKAKGDTCWFSYGTKEYATNKFFWLTSMRPVQLERNLEGPPKSAIECGYQLDEVGYLYAAIAETKWGRIPGKAKDSICWYPYEGKEYTTSEFYWLVR